MVEGTTITPGSSVNAARMNATTTKFSPKPGEENVSDKERREIKDLERREREVKRHERAHRAAGAGLVVGGIKYKYKTGPDGKRYAVAGEVNLDVSPERDPQKTIQKAERIKRAALAPAEPSAQDRRVARQAEQMKREAQRELAAQRRQEGANYGAVEVALGTRAVFIDARA